MLDIIDWSKERPRHDDLGRYALDVQKAAPKTKFVYHIGMSGSSSMLKELCLGPLKLCHYLLTKGVTENGTETVFG